MSKTVKALLVICLATFAFSAVAEAGWIHQVNSAVQADAKKQRHPLRLDQIVVNQFAAENYSVCVAYATSSAQDGKGKIDARVEVRDIDGELKKKMRFKLRVNGGAAFGCKNGVELGAGDMVEFDYKFKKMPRLRTVNGTRGGVAISGIVSTAGQPGIGSGPLALDPPGPGTTPRGLVPGDDGGWFSSTNSVFHSSRKGTQQPSLMSHMLRVPRDTESRPLVCSAYNSADGVAPNRGEVFTLATIFYPDGETQILELSGDVEESVHAVCERASRKLKRGVMISFEHDLSAMPKLDRGKHGDLVSAISTTGEPSFRSNGGGGGGDGPPVPGAVFVAADHYAITEVLSKPNFQLRRQTGNRPAKYVIVGPGSVPDPARHGFNFDSTTGNGATPALALADWVSKHGPIGGRARLMTDSERRSMEHFDRINASGGPTGFRVDRGGGLHGDVYRPWFGVQQGGPFRTIEQTVNYFIALGL